MPTISAGVEPYATLTGFVAVSCLAEGAVLKYIKNNLLRNPNVKAKQPEAENGT